MPITVFSKLPNSFIRDGFISPDQAAKQDKNGKILPFRRLMLATEGDGDSGKTEFMLSCPGPGIIISLDKNFDATLDNPNPPLTRNKNFAMFVVRTPLPGSQITKALYMDHWVRFYSHLILGLDNPEARTVCMDTDSDSWELQRLAEWGEVIPMSGHPSLGFKGVNAARRALYSRCWESGKIIAGSNKLKDEYGDVLDASGKAVMDGNRAKREKTGEREAQGFGDQEFLWQIRIRHLFKAASYNNILKKNIPMQWGLRILRCKVNKELEGTELWGDECNFKGLVQCVYPEVPLKDWGF